MKLPSLPFLKEKTKNEYFLSLVFREDRLESYIFEKAADEIRVINEQTEALEDTIDNTKFEDILDIADKLITQAEDETRLPLEISKTIFGLKESWVEDSKIKPENLAILKKLCEGLGLSPIGFMTISEGVVALLQKEEGAPPSAILTEVGGKNVTVSLVKAGKIIETRQSEIHQSTAFTVDTLLKHFEKMEILPARFVILSEDDDLVQEFIAHPWSKSLPFLHLPQISNLPSGFMGKSLALGIAKQVGAELADNFTPPPPPVEQNLDEEAQEEIAAADKPIEPEVEEEVKPQVQTSNIEYISDAKEFFGFADKDVAKIEPPKPEIAVETADEQTVTEEIPEEVKAEVSGRQMLPAGVMLFIPKVKSVFHKVFSKAKGANIPKPPVKNRMFLFALIPIALILLLILYYFLGLKATVVLSLEPRIVEKTQQITFSDASDFENNIIKGETISVDEDGSVTTNATGKKETGDKAKGTVTVFNSSARTVTLPVKTKVTSQNGLNFFTLGAVTIASRSADVPPEPGKNNVNVEAEKFGSEYNLPSGIKFTSINNDEDLSAKNDSPFSGGTKKEVVVVSKTDLQNAREDLSSALEDKAKDDLQNKLGPDQEILPELLTSLVTEEDFDKDEGQEAKTVTLKGTVTYSSLAYSRSELLEYLKTIFGPGETTIDTKNLELSFENIKSVKGDVTADLKIKAKIFPKLDIEKLSRQIAGKSFKEAEKILFLPQVEDIRIKFSPNLFFFPKNLPRIFDNIKIEILENG